MIRVGIIGSGPIASKHLEVLASFDDVAVTAVSSRRQAPRDALAKQFGIARQFDAFDDLLGEPLDAVLVLVTPDAIPAVTTAALSRSIPTFLEKPPGLTFRDAESLAELAYKLGVRNQVGLNRRFYSVIASARRAVDESGCLFGIHVEAPEAIERARAAGRSEHVLRHWVAANSLHAIDLLRYFGGDVRARHRVNRADPRSTENSMAALLQFESGAIGQYTAHWGSPGRWAVSVYGRGIKAVLTPLERGVLHRADGDEQSIAVDDVDVRFKPGFYRQLEVFLNQLRDRSKGPAPAADLADAARSMELAEWLSGGVH